MRVLFLGCHCDDIELGCGATIHKKKTWNTTCVVLSSTGLKNSYPDLSTHCRAAMLDIGVKDVRFFDFPPSFFPYHRQEIWETLNKINDEIKPDIVFTQEEDDHQDHTVLAQETRRNFRYSSVIRYTVMRSCMGFMPNLFVTLSNADMEAKIKALGHYSMYKNKNFFRPENVEAQLRASGVYLDEEFVEAFQVEKMLLKHDQNF